MKFAKEFILCLHIVHGCHCHQVADTVKSEMVVNFLSSIAQKERVRGISTKGHFRRRVYGPVSFRE